MKKKEFEQFKTKPAHDLTKEIETLRGKLNDLKFDLSVGKVKNVHEVRSIRKAIAQLFTLLQGQKSESINTK